MRQLLLLRHAKSSWDDPKLSDHARPLNPRGRRAAAAIRATMLELGLEPDLVLVSSARRTLQTLEGLSPWRETPMIEPMDALYLASVAQLLDVINGVPDTVRNILLIGHNPGLHDLALSLIGANAIAEADPAAESDILSLVESYPTAALAAFAVAGSWSALRDGGGRLLRFVRPRDLPEPIAS